MIDLAIFIPALIFITCFTGVILLEKNVHIMIKDAVLITGCFVIAIVLLAFVFFLKLLAFALLPIVAVAFAATILFLVLKHTKNEKQN